jgi:hypothetical protein
MWGDLLALGLLLVAASGEGIASLLEKVWGLYARVLNLPILVGAVLDGAAGVFFGMGMLGAESAVAAFSGFLLAVGSTFFAAGSVVTWVVKVRGERDELEHLPRPPEPAPIAGREPRGLDSPHHTTSQPKGEAPWSSCC